jgi:hypothetical protein
LFPKCDKTHLRASTISKIFPGVIPQAPVKGEGKGFGRERDKGIVEEGMEIREGGRNKGGNGKEK